MRLFVQMLPWHSLSVCHVHIQVIRCGNRKMAERTKLIFTMETDSPVLDGSPDSQRGTVILTFVGQSTMYLPLLVKECAYLHRSTYVLG